MWGVVQTEPCRETSVSDRLTHSGFATYLPQVASGTRRLPLFPTYVLVDVAASWWCARWTPGVVRLLMAGDQPARLADAEVDRLRQRERNGLVVLPAAPGFAPGDRVRVKDGAFCGFNGLFQRMAAHDRVRVLVQLLGQQVPLDLARHQVEGIAVAEKIKRG